MYKRKIYVIHIFNFYLIIMYIQIQHQNRSCHLEFWMLFLSVMFRNYPLDLFQTCDLVFSYSRKRKSGFRRTFLKSRTTIYEFSIQTCFLYLAVFERFCSDWPFQKAYVNLISSKQNNSLPSETVLVILNQTGPTVVI